MGQTIAQLEQAATDMGFDRAERLSQMLGQFGMGEAMEEGQRDGLALLSFQFMQAAMHVMRLAFFTQRRIRHLPVVDGDQPVGMLSIRDILDDIIADQEATIEQLEAYIKS